MTPSAGRGGPLPDRGPVVAGLAGLAAGWFLALLASIFLVHPYRGYASGWRPDPLASGELVEVVAAAFGAFGGAAVAARLTNVRAAGAVVLGAAVGFLHGLFSVAWHTPNGFWPAVTMATMAAAAAGERIFRTPLAPPEPAPPSSFGPFVEGTGQTDKLRACSLLASLGVYYFGISLSSRESNGALLGLAVALAATACPWALIRCPRCHRRVVASVGMALGIPRRVRSLAACPHCAYAP